MVTVEAIPHGTLIAKWYPYDRRVIATVYASMQDFTVSLPKSSLDDGGAIDSAKHHHAQHYSSIAYRKIVLIEIFLNSMHNVDQSYNFFEGEKRTE